MGVCVSERIRAAQQQPAFCKDGSTNTFAKYFPMPGPSARQIEMYDPKTKQFTSIDTCFAADHNHFDEHDALVFGQNNATGWVDTATFDKTHDAAAWQGWCPGVLDTNGEGKITEWTEPNRPIDSQKDHRIEFGCYSDAISPIDGSVWCSGIGARDTKLVRIERGANAPLTRKAEMCVPPPEKMPLPVRAVWRWTATAWSAELAGRPSDDELRSPPVQDAERTERHGAAVPGGSGPFTRSPAPRFRERSTIFARTCCI
jgi:hypothetical protein